MYASWKKTLTAPEQQPVAHIINNGIRYIRRGMYQVQRTARTVADIITRVASKLFIAIFPKAKRALKPIDPLTGLKKGPSSYFLFEISTDKDASTILGKHIPHIRRTKKNM